MIPKQQGLQFVILLFKCFYCYIGDNQWCICKGSFFCHLMRDRMKPPFRGIFGEAVFDKFKLCSVINNVVFTKGVKC